MRFVHLSTGTLHRVDDCDHVDVMDRCVSRTCLFVCCVTVESVPCVCRAVRWAKNGVRRIRLSSPVAKHSSFTARLSFASGSTSSATDA